MAGAARAWMLIRLSCRRVLAIVRALPAARSDAPGRAITTRAACTERCFVS